MVRFIDIGGGGRITTLKNVFCNYTADDYICS